MIKALIFVALFLIALAGVCVIGNVLTEYHKQKERYDYLKDCEHRKNRTSAVIAQSALDEVTEEIKNHNK